MKRYQTLLLCLLTGFPTTKAMASCAWLYESWRGTRPSHCTNEPTWSVRDFILQMEGVCSCSGDHLDFSSAMFDSVGLDGAVAVTSSPDGAFLYVASYDDQAIAVFRKDEATGDLALIEVQRHGIHGVDGLETVSALTVSPDGNHLYASGGSEVAVFQRNITTGVLSWVEVLRDNVNGVDGIRGAHSVTISDDGKNLYVTGDNDNAIAVFQRGMNGTLTFLEIQRNGTNGVDGLDFATSTTISPDGLHLYATGSGEHTVAVFQRDPMTGALTFLEFHRNWVDGVEGLKGAITSRLSPDGNFLYVAGYQAYALAVFQRDATTGLLTFLTVYRDDAAGVDGLEGPTSIAISGDGHYLYATGTRTDSVQSVNALAVFQRDQSTGALLFLEVHRDGINGVDGLDGAFTVSISPDGNHLYVAGRRDDAVAVFETDQTTGLLTYVVVNRAGIDGVDGLDGASSVTVSPDGDHLYAIGNGDHAVLAFSRNQTTGALTHLETWRNGSNGISGLTEATSIVSSPDGRHLYVTGYGDDALVLFQRDPLTGSLGFVAAYRDGVNGITGLGGAISSTMSRDGRYLYATGYRDDAVVVFQRDEMTGSLTFISETRNGIDGVEGLDGAIAATVSPDNGYLYVAGHIDDAVAVFRRDEGTLTFLEVQRDQAGGVDGLDGAYAVLVSPDGNHLYVAGHWDHKIAVFQRAPDTGLLTLVTVLQDGINGVDGLYGVSSLVTSQDGNYLYVSGAADNSVAVFQRDQTTGVPSFLEIQRNGENGVTGLHDVRAITLSPDGNHLYTASFRGDALTIFGLFPQP